MFHASVRTLVHRVAGESRSFLRADVYNKVDAISLEQVDKLARADHTVVISCELGLKCVDFNIFLGYWTLNRAVRSLDYLIERIWDELGLVKVYTKKRGAHPDLTDPICLRKGATVEVRPMLSRPFCRASDKCPGRLQRHPSVLGGELPVCTSLVSTARELLSPGCIGR